MVSIGILNPFDVATGSLFALGIKQCFRLWVIRQTV